MALRMLALCLVIGMVLPEQLVSGQSSSADVDLATGIRQVREGDFDAAVITLDGVVKRLSAQKSQAKELGRAYTYLAIAYVGLAQQETAKAKFLEAWKADKSIILSPKEFPPNIIDFFDQAKKEGEEKAETEAKPTSTTPKPGPKPVATTEKTEKKSAGAGGKTALIVVGALAAVGGIALAAKGGTSSPTLPPTPPCTAGSDFDFNVDFAFSGSFNCGQSNIRAQTYRITNRSCSALTVQRLVLNRGLTAGTSCSVTPSEELAVNGTTVVAAAAGTPTTAVIRTGSPAGTAHYFCCSAYPCTVGSCSLNEGYTVTTSAGTKTVTNTVTVIENTARDCVLCSSGSFSPYSVGRTQARDGQLLLCRDPY
jgi:hypothetical protein